MNDTRSIDGVLIVCTRNRHEYLSKLLENLKLQTLLPRALILVDASDDAYFRKEGLLEVESVTKGRYDLHNLHCEPGLPSQRNYALEYISANPGLSESKYICFLDDDIILNSDYFGRVEKLLSENADLACLGGYASNFPPNKVGIFRKIAGLGGHGDEGRVLSTGFALTIHPTNEIQEVDWVPGFAMNFHHSKIRKHRFNDEIRMYGEDLDFQSSLVGPIATSKYLNLTHLHSPTGRKSLRHVTSYTDGFRWELAKSHRFGVRKFPVLYSTLALAFAELFLSVFKVSKAHFFMFLGHLDFVSRLILRRPVQEQK